MGTSGEEFEKDMDQLFDIDEEEDEEDEDEEDQEDDEECSG